MVIFKRLFACYYFLFLKMRKIHKSRIEDSQAKSSITMILVLIVGACSKLFNFKILDTSISSKIFAVAFVLFFDLLCYKYFLSNRNRRNRIIDEYRNLSKYRKNLWIAFSLLIMFGPLFYILL